MGEFLRGRRRLRCPHGGGLSATEAFATVIVPNDEYLARPHLVAWLAYPLDIPAGHRFRTRTRDAIEQWARHLSGQAREGKKGRIDSALGRAARELDRQLLAGEIFRRQLLKLEHDDGLFQSTSTKAFARSYATFHRRDADNLGSEIRDSWTKRRSACALAAAICEGLPRRPDLESLLFLSQNWALRAVERAEGYRLRALRIGHPAAASIWKLKADHF